jgi:hypothetical protein
MDNVHLRNITKLKNETLSWQLRHWLYYFKKCWNLQAKKFKIYFGRKKQWLFKNILFVEMGILKSINYWTGICWSCQGTKAISLMSYSGTKQIRVFPLGRWDVWSCLCWFQFSYCQFHFWCEESTVRSTAVMSINGGEHRLHFVTSLGRVFAT